MFLLRLVLLVFLAMMIRRIYRSWRKVASLKGQKSDGPVHTDPPEQAKYSDLTEQGIDDADFEEIP